MKNEVVRHLKHRFILAVLLFAAIAIIDFFVIEYHTRTASRDAEITNLAGRQRMLAGQIAFLAGHLTLTDTPTEIAHSIAEMHRELSLLTDPLGGYMAVTEVRDLYLAGEQAIARQTTAYLDAAAKGDGQRVAALYPPLVTEMNHAVTAYATHAAQRITLLRWIEVAGLMVQLLVIWGIGLAIFKPMARRIDKDFQALDAARTLTRSIIDAAGEGICGITPQGDIIFINAAACRMFGCTEEEVLGVNLHTLAHHHEADGSPATIETCPLLVAAMNGQELRMQMDALWRKDGSSFPVELVIAPLQTPENLAGAIIVFSDITDRKLADAQLRESKERLEAAASAGIVGVWDWDVVNNRLIWDAVMYQLYGTRKEDFGEAYEAWASAIHPDDKARTEAAIQAALRGECEYAPEFRVIWPDGSVHHIKAMSHTTFGKHGEALRMVGVNYDLTEQKSIEEKLERGIAERTKALKKAREAAEAANVAKSAFLANMSHEMRTPLHQVHGMAQLIRREPLSPKQDDRMNKLENACRNLTTIIDTILELTIIEAGQFDLVEEAFSPLALLDEVIAEVQAQASSKSLQLVCDADNVPASLMGDQKHIKKALLNYVSNAIRFTEAGTISLRLNMAAEVDDAVLIRFEVQDDGMGIDPQDRSRLFSIFEQVDNSLTRSFGGLGMGLAMTKKIAEIMGGEAGCNSTPGQGSTFWFTVRLKKVVPVSR